MFNLCSKFLTFKLLVFQLTLLLISVFSALLASLQFFYLKSHEEIIWIFTLLIFTTPVLFLVGALLFVCLLLFKKKLFNKNLNIIIFLLLYLVQSGIVYFYFVNFYLNFSDGRGPIWIWVLALLMPTLLKLIVFTGLIPLILFIVFDIIS